jgi:hypothetical protein
MVQAALFAPLELPTQEILAAAVVVQQVVAVLVWFVEEHPLTTNTGLAAANLVKSQILPSASVEELPLLPRPLPNLLPLRPNLLHLSVLPLRLLNHHLEWLELLHLLLHQVVQDPVLKELIYQEVSLVVLPVDVQLVLVMRTHSKVTISQPPVPVHLTLLKALLVTSIILLHLE